MVERKATQQPHRTVDVGTRADKSSVRAYTTMSAFLQEKASSIEPKVSSVAQDEKIAAEFVASNHADPTESVETSLLKVRGYIQHTFNRDLVWCHESYGAAIRGLECLPLATQTDKWRDALIHFILLYRQGYGRRL